MEVKLKRADIVILARAHNPSIVAPDWLRSNALITEEPKQFVHTPDFSIFDSESFILVVDHQRWQLTGKKQDRKTLASQANIASGYVNLLPHIPYQALGLNFTWSIEYQGEEAIAQISLKIDSTNPASLFPDHEINYGGIIYAKKDPYLLKLVIERQEDSILMHNFNYHHELQTHPIEKIADFIKSFLVKGEDSKNIIEKLYSIEVKYE